jgi:hypothetical protein
VRVAQFAVFIARLAVRGAAPASGSWGIDARWIYGLAVLAVGALLATFWREYGELALQRLPDSRELCCSPRPSAWRHSGCGSSSTTRG